MRKTASTLTVTLATLFLITSPRTLASCPANQLEVPDGCIPYPTQKGTVGVNRVLKNFQQLDLGGILSSLLPYIFIFAGLTMLAFLIFGGFQLMTSEGDPKSIQSGQGKIVNALLGFGIIFASYWIIQILQVIFHVSIISAI